MKNWQFATLAILVSVFLGHLFLSGVKCATDEVREDRERKEICAISVKKVEQFLQDTKPRLCKTESLECLRMERDALLLVLEGCKKVRP